MDTPATARKMFKDVEEFYKNNESRRFSGEADYGVHWRLESYPHPWRVSCVHKTEEVYAVHLDGSSGPLIVLGIVPPDTQEDTLSGPTYHETLDRILEGWTDHCGLPHGLNWVRDRIASHPQSQAT